MPASRQFIIKMLIDLQVHSTYSDGYLTPSELVGFLSKQKVKAAALTDHNTVAGLEEFRKAASKAGIKTIDGLELYVRLNGKRFNLLWYNFDPASPALHNMLRESQIRRRRKLRAFLEGLCERGFKLTVHKTMDRYTHYVPINRIVDEFISVRENLKRIRKELKNQNPTEKDIIKHYFFDPRFAMLRDSYINVERVFHLRKKIGGQLVLCHPAKNKAVKEEFWLKLKRKGLDGIELLSPHHSYGAVMHMQTLARRLGLIETGGSDFHRLESGSHPIQYAGQYYSINSRLLKGSDKVIGQL